MRISSSSSCGPITQWSSPAPQTSTCSPTTRGTLSNSVAWTCSPCRVHNSCKRWTIYKPKKANYVTTLCVWIINLTKHSCSLHPLYSFQINFSEAFSLSIPGKNFIYQTQQLVLHGNTKRLFVYHKYILRYASYFHISSWCSICDKRFARVWYIHFSIVYWYA